MKCSAAAEVAENDKHASLLNRGINCVCKKVCTAKQRKLISMCFAIVSQIICHNEIITFSKKLSNLP